MTDYILMLMIYSFGIMFYKSAFNIVGKRQVFQAAIWPLWMLFLVLKGLALGKKR